MRRALNTEIIATFTSTLEVHLAVLDCNANRFACTNKQGIGRERTGTVGLHPSIRAYIHRFAKVMCQKATSSTSELVKETELRYWLDKSN